MLLTRLPLFLLLFAFFTLPVVDGLTTEAWAQDTEKLDKKQLKQIKKAWKKKAKAYKKNPLALKAKEEAFQKQMEEMNDRLKKCEAGKEEILAEMDKMEQKARDAARRSDSLENELGKLRTAYEAKKTEVKKDVDQGLIFRVQIGAFEKFSMDQYLEKTGESFTGESMDNMNKYLVGKFRDLQMAHNFRDDIRKMGIKDAWVVPYRDGVRISMDEAKQIMGAGGMRP